eukprot:TRINITY_DN84143_c0_g1_i1.p1 TRINITY_DN84143_c0_g1~~TRINITY_DN84143_c0_g1_i1.p1  ORF type:complete len:309 (-),score=44.39 TRINITY_DN84143_c0_g1_i1:52-915(-)
MDRAAIVEGFEKMEVLLTNMHTMIFMQWNAMGITPFQMPCRGPVFVEPSLFELGLKDSAGAPAASPSRKRRLRAKNVRTRLWNQLQGSAFDTGENSIVKGKGVISGERVLDKGGNFSSVASESDKVEDTTKSENVTEAAGDMKAARTESRVIGLDIIDLEFIDHRVDHLMKKLRGTFPLWPPVQDMCEQTGRNTIHKMCEDEVARAVVQALQEQGVRQPTPSESKKIRTRVSDSVRSGLDKWKSFARLVSSEVEESGGAEASEAFQLKPLSQRGMSQPKARSKKKQK